MRSLALAAVLVSATLVACGAADSDDGSSEQDLVTDAGAPAIDGGPILVLDGGAPSSDAGGPVLVTDAGLAVPTYAEVGPSINATCGGCHSGKFNSLDKVKANKTRMFNAISAGRMPKNNPTWRTTREGKAVLDFLANSPELQ